MKLVQQPGGPSDQENGIVGAPRSIRVDTTKGELRLHDGLTPGGRRLPNLEQIQQLIASGAEGAVGSLRIVADELDLAALQPSANYLVAVRANGLEEAYIWNPGAPAVGDIASSIDGYWRRLSSTPGLIVRMWRAGLINLQINGAQPVVNMDTTPWLINNVIKLWDGAAYVVATPTTFARLLAKMGNYFTGAVSMPDRLGSILIEAPSVNAIAESGWMKSAVADVDMPLAGVHPIHTYWNNLTGYQIVYPLGNTGGDTFRRNRAAGSWGAWISVLGQLPARLTATPTILTDCDSHEESNGWAQIASTGAHLPFAGAGFQLEYQRNAGGYGVQIAHSLTTPVRTHKRFKNAGVYGAWIELADAGAVAKASTIVAADKILILDSANGSRPSTRTWTEMLATMKIVDDGYYSPLGHVHAFNTLTGIPTTIAGYGITDNTFANLLAKPTTLAGYGITNAVNKAGDTMTGGLTISVATSILELRSTTVGQSALIDFTAGGRAADFDWRLQSDSAASPDYLFLNASSQTVLRLKTNGNVEILGALSIAPAQNSSRLYMYDADESTSGPKSLHANQNFIGFLNGATAWQVYWQHGGYQVNTGGASFGGDVTVTGNHFQSGTAMMFTGAGNRRVYADGSGIGLMYTDGTYIIQGNNSKELVVYGDRVRLRNSNYALYYDGGTTIGFLGSTGGYIFNADNAGAVWTAQFGDLSSRIEARASAWAATRMPYDPGYGGVGAYHYGFHNGNNGANVNVAGSALCHMDSGAAAGFGGTWRIMTRWQYTAPNSYCLYLRLS